MHDSLVLYNLDLSELEWLIAYTVLRDKSISLGCRLTIGSRLKWITEIIYPFSFLSAFPRYAEDL